MRRRRRRSVGSRLAVVVFLACACGLVGVLVGRAQRIPNAQAATVQSDAATVAFHRAEAAAYGAAFRAGYHAGWVRGSALARKRARRAGRAAAHAHAIQAGALESLVAAARNTLAAAYSPVSPAAAKHPDKCVEVGGGLCEVAGPAITHKACPAGSVPDPATDSVCVPELLIEVEQQAAQAAAAASTAP